MLQSTLEKWRSLPTMALDAFAILMGSWWLYSVVLVYSYQSFDTLVMGLFLPLLLGIALCAALVRPAVAPLPVPEPTPPSWLPAGLLPVGFGLGCWWALGLPFWFAWVPIAVYTGLLVRYGGAMRGPASVELSTKDAVSLLLAMGFAFALVSGIHRPEVDDAYHINAMIGALEHPELPVLSFDGLHGDVNAPIQQLIHRPQTYEIFIAALARVTGMNPRSIYWMFLPALIGPLMAISVWRFLKALAPDHAWAAIWLVFAVWLAWGDDYRAYGSYTFARLSQGKPVFITLFVPAILYSAARYSDRPSARSFGLLCLTQCAAATYTSSALLLGPIAAGIGLLAQIRFTRRGLIVAALGLLASVPLLSALVAMKLEVMGVGGLRHDGWMRDMNVVLGTTLRAPLALFAVVLLPALLVARKSPAGPWAARLVAVSFLLVYNGMTAPFLADHVAELFSWRLYWIVPVPMLASLGVVVALGTAIHSKRWPNIVGTVLVTLVLLGAFWTAGERAYERRFITWKWWTHKTPDLEQRLALKVLSFTESTDLVLAAPRVAERITGLDGRPRLISVRESYLTNLSRYWGEEQASERLAMMKFAERPQTPKEADAAIELIEAWCVDVIVFRRYQSKESKKLMKKLEPLGFVDNGRTKKYQMYRRTGECTPTRP